jgi:inosine/xanthosine triphosphate pyrophosphatase family protein
MVRPIVLATSNPAKRAQLRWVLEGLPFEPLDVEPLDVVEAGPDLAANAAAKALAHSASGLSIASDGGLEVPGLAGRWDPLLTHRQGQDKLRELAASLEDRRTRWSEAVAVAYRGRLLAVWTESGTEGVLAPEPWPPPGDFWVWDVFHFPEVGKVWSRLSAAERERVDHTWLALKAALRAFAEGGGADA